MLNAPSKHGASSREAGAVSGLIGASAGISCGKGHEDRRLLTYGQIPVNGKVQKLLDKYTKAKSNPDSGSVCRRRFSQ
jgi:hypothetical protein